MSNTSFIGVRCVWDSSFFYQISILDDVILCDEPLYIEDSNINLWSKKKQLVGGSSLSSSFWRKDAMLIIMSEKNWNDLWTSFVEQGLLFRWTIEHLQKICLGFFPRCTFDVRISNGVLKKKMIYENREKLCCKKKVAPGTWHVFEWFISIWYSVIVR